MHRLIGIITAAIILITAGFGPGEAALAAKHDHNDAPAVKAKPAAAAKRASDPAPDAPAIDMPAGILMDAKTGEVLWEKNPDQKRSVASTTKIMTAILALESDRLEDTMSVSAEAQAANTYGIKLTANEVMVVKDLLYALMLPSANDSAVALANKVGGTTENFISMMNLKAVNLGAKNTNFTNPHGLTNGEHYSTARDLATITRYALRNKSFVQVVSTKEARVNRQDPKQRALLENRNKLLWTYPGAIGVKTGHTKSAGFCLVSAAERDGMRFISVLLGGTAPDAVFNQSAALLDYGFSSYEKKRLIQKGKVYQVMPLPYGKRLALISAETKHALVKRSAKTRVEVVLDCEAKPPIKRGAVLGTVNVYDGAKKLSSARLMAKSAIERPGILQVLGYYVKSAWAAIF